jgi:hypothetical protein
MLVTELGIVGGVVSDVQSRRKLSPTAKPEKIPNSSSITSFLSISTISSFIIDE